MGCGVQPLLASPKGRGLKRIRSEICLSRRRVYFASRFSPLPFGYPEGATTGGRLLLLTFLGEARKVSGPPGPVPASLFEETTAPNHRRKNTPPIFRLRSP